MLLPVCSQISSRATSVIHFVHFCQESAKLLGLGGQGGRNEGVEWAYSVHPGVRGVTAISHPTWPFAASLGQAGARQMAVTLLTAVSDSG